MGIFGMVLVNEEDYNKYVKMNWESERVKQLEKQRDYLREELDKAQKDPNSFLRGRRYSSGVVKECIETLKICKDKMINNDAP